ncbi:xanthine dehydrogenase family protein molybdopterin-binding subunit [Promicromonospora kroppenstedtii]|uniref:xanthine dehydrogenase family protein molybdopterin-binding subunit n=1 Tax=Promicromonospora kroppenstedtii TaxID=440482 RepID=UPI0004ADA6EB|nr:xanthine dehydrogenase family protein molybdopterin-binding subunit [Promicromonospora kroppenstedtii]
MAYTPIGREIDRIDGRLKVTGAAQYSGDHPAPALVHAYLITSSIGLGRIRAMDTAAALDAPGVLDVYSPFNPLRLYVMPGLGENYAPLQDPEVRFHGQIIAMVVAESFEQARDAAALVTTTYDATTPRTSLDDEPSALPETTPGGHPAGSTVLAPGVASIDAALTASDVVVQARFHQDAQHHVAMEPHVTLAQWRDGILTVHSGTQVPLFAVMLIAARLGIPADRVQVMSKYVGGGFGSKVLSWYDTSLAAAAADVLNRPVRLVLTREQVFQVIGRRGQINQTVRLGASRDGVLTAVSHVTDAEMPAVGGWHMVAAETSSGLSYRTPNLHVEDRQVALDMSPTWAMRAPNEAPGAFALETAMDELAVATGVDPVELRLRNYTTVVPGTERPWTSKYLDECYHVGARRFGWSARSATPRARTDGDWLIGMGMASAVYPTDRQPATVRVRLHADNTAVVSTATVDPGTGAATMVATVGADALGIPIRRIELQYGDSTLPQGGSSVGSGATASTVPAVQAAARAAVDELRRLAVTSPRSPWHGIDPADLHYENGRLRSADRAMTFGQLLTTVGTPAVGGEGSHQPGDEANRYAIHSFGAHFCEVRVNRHTGEPRVNRFTTVVDAGRVVNARAARSQLVGGVIMGIGHALLEHNPVEPGTGRLAASNLADYMVPVNADIPDIDVHWLDRPDPVLSELGAKGLGEIGTVASAAAVGNAVFNATGVRVRDLPITLDKLLQDD